MTCTRMSGITMMRSERPKRLRGNARLTRLRWSSAGCPARAAAPPAAGGGAGRARLWSIGLEDIAGAADGLEVARELRVLLDLAPEPRHLDVDGAHIAAELRL